MDRIERIANRVVDFPFKDQPAPNGAIMGILLGALMIASVLWIL